MRRTRFDQERCPIARTAEPPPIDLVDSETGRPIRPIVVDATTGRPLEPAATRRHPAPPAETTSGGVRC